MSYWRSCLLISCILLSGCALRTGSRANIAPASSGPSRTYAYTTPRHTIPSVHQPVVRQTPVTHLPHVALLSPRMQGFYRANPNLQSASASVSQVDTKESVGDDKTIIAQPPDSKAVGQISSAQVVAANVFPVLEPHYAGPIAAMIIIGALIYYALYRFAGSGQKMAVKKESTGYPVTYHTDTQINYHYDDTGGQKTETRHEDRNAGKGDPG